MSEVLLAGLAICALPAVVVADLMHDVPRLARWLGRRAEGLLPSHDRAFFGWAAEIEHAAAEAADGTRSRVSVLGAASVMFVTALGRRVKGPEVRYAVDFERSPEDAKVHFPILDAGPDDLQGESAWATWIGEDDQGDLYRLENHLWFTEVAFCGDVIRADFVPLDDKPGYGVLEFAEVVTETELDEVNLWNNWRIAPKWRLRRLHRELCQLGMSSEWASCNLGRGALPEEPDHLLRMLRRRRVYWEMTERVSAPARDTE